MAKIAVIGSGTAARQWSILFASAGYTVALHDVRVAQLSVVLDDIGNRATELEELSLLRGHDTAAGLLGRISTSASLVDAVKGAALILECMADDLTTKRQMIQQLDQIVASSNTLASSTSAFLPSQLAEGLTHKHRFLVIHTLDPLFHIPLVEIVPLTWTDKSTISYITGLMKDLGREPVVLNKEIRGFVANTIATAVFAESWRLIKDGIISAADLDKVMTAGLGRRYAYLNSEGLVDAMQRYGPTIYSVARTFAPLSHLDGDTAETIDADMKDTIPNNKTRKDEIEMKIAALYKLIHEKTTP